MLGYITINKPELKIREYELYHSYYCGLCQALRRRYGWSGQLTLTYDMTFLVILLSSLYEPENKSVRARCMTHPVSEHLITYNVITDYASDMNIILAYHSLMDDWKDNHDWKAYIAAGLMKKKYTRAACARPEQCRAVVKYIKKLYACEKANSRDIDEAAGIFGRLLGRVFIYKEDEWSGYLRRMGFYLGKFIYLMDAFEDLEKDEINGSYNPFLCRYGIKDGNEDVFRDILTRTMAECAKEFEKLPILDNAGILRNILYAGVWSRYDRVRFRRSKEKQGEKRIQAASDYNGHDTGEKYE